MIYGTWAIIKITQFQSPIEPPRNPFNSLSTILYPLYTHSQMFTGIIEATARVLQKTDTQLVIERPASFDHITIGASIAVSGVCLSVTSEFENSISFDVVEETWNKSKLGSLKEGDLVNLERACLADSRLDGHVVQGHCEGVGNVECRMNNEGLKISMPNDLIKFCVQKGSISLDGVSLTIVEAFEDHITVALVPLTLEKTTLGTIKPGDPINIETDIVGRYLYAFTHEATALQT